MVHLSENEGIENRIFVVTGGAGFVGRALCLELARRGAAEVRSFDRSGSPEHLSNLRKHGIVCINGDIRRKDDVEKAFKQANCVFHLASFGMSGKEMLQARKIDEVNLDGTCNVLDSCVKCGVERLVYTSTYNVVFGGKEIRNGHEAMDYYPLDDHVDPYGRSKALAEQLVLRSNNRPLSKDLRSSMFWIQVSQYMIGRWGKTGLCRRVRELQNSLVIGDSNLWRHHKILSHFGQVLVRVQGMLKLSQLVREALETIISAHASSELATLVQEGREEMPEGFLKEISEANDEIRSFSHMLPLNRSRAGRKLYTCAIRPAAIYGPGEERHLPRILHIANAGLYLFRIGGLDTKQDWVYVDNLVQGQLLASMGLLEDIPDKGTKAPAAGQAYFISDGAPINTAKFLSPLIEGLGYKNPEKQISVQTALRLSWFIWGLYGILYPWLEKRWLPQPFILPAEVYKVGITHYFSILKARQELGYVPLVNTKEGMSRTIDYFKMKQEREILIPSFLTKFLVISGLLSVFVSAFVPLDFQGPFRLGTSLGLLIFRSIFVLRLVAISAAMCHIGEAIYAWRLALKADSENANAWFWQTLVIGFRSLIPLMKRAKSREEAKQL